MRMYDIIMKKRNGGELSKEEIHFFIEGYTRGEIPDYQVSALMMAIYFQKMTEKETYELTMAMAHIDTHGGCLWDPGGQDERQRPGPYRRDH